MKIKRTKKIGYDSVKHRLLKPERVSSGGEGVAAVTSATQIRFMLGGTIYIA